MKICWLDLETTGTDPHADSVLAIGVRITDEHLNVLGEFETAVAWSEACIRSFKEHAAPVVLEMHEKNGLWAECRTAEGLNIAAAWSTLEHFLDVHRGTEKLTLAGNSVHFDRNFMLIELGHEWLQERFEYRILDVSVFKVLAKMWGWPLPPKSSPEAKEHLPLKDLDHSLRELTYWVHPGPIKVSRVARELLQPVIIKAV